MISLPELAKRLDARLVSDWDDAQLKKIQLNKISPIDQARAGEVTFVSKPEYMRFLSSTKASAVILAEQVPECKIPQLVHKNPYLAFAKTAQIFLKTEDVYTGISPQAVVHESARVGKNVSIDPFTFVGAGTQIGDNTRIMANVSLGADVRIGKNCLIFPGVVIYHACEIGSNVILHAGCVIGADGFGFAVGDGEIVKIPQTGIVVIEDNVEIGATSTVARAAMGVTRIKKNCKLDSRVQVGHNVEVGENCMLSAFTGLAGSSKLGDWVIMGGQSGLNSHTKIASGSRIGAQTGVIWDTEEGGEYLGFPAIPAGEWRRRQVHLSKLGEYEKRLRELEKIVKK